ncbi:MAG: HD domain-containing protein, partial [Lachnospiraceae bacterium]|nr:HD domain-containing protein [Lachnospiraceae bacterium]
MKKRQLPYILLCAIGIIVNYAGALLATRLRLPIYLDTMGTIGVSAIGGLLPGITVGFLTNVFNSFVDQSNIYYALVNVVLAVCTSFLASRGSFKHFRRWPLIIVLLGVVSGVLGGTLEWSMNYGALGDGASGVMAQKVIAEGVPGTFFPLIIVNIFLNLVDKAITILVVFPVLSLLPKSVEERFESEENRFSLTETEGYGFSLRTKVLVIISAIAVLITTVVSVSFISLYHEAVIVKEAKLAHGVAHTAMSNFDADRVNEYINMDVNDPEYAEIRNKIGTIANSSEDIAYVYAYQIREDGCYVVFDPDTTEGPGAMPGDVIDFDPSFLDVVPALLDGETIEPIVSNDSYGWLLTVYEPVYDSAGDCQCYVGVDISMTYLTENERVFLVKVISLFLGIFIVIFCYVTWMANRAVIRPINAMAGAMSNFATGISEDRRDSAQRIHELQIKSGDEMEYLFHSLESTIDEIVEYIADVQSKNRQISQMQQALIMVLADMVESRDKCTGNHVRNTANYVQMILEKMAEDGIYEDELTDDFLMDTVAGAPLHDVGKIQVPDAILNKPGRLTQEEFEIMKYHTTAGGEMIDKAIAMMHEGTGAYLKEARNLTLYHHERWDGRGYPAGLKGEEIPLSARVMAVADVFDALMSKRSYKEGFAFEKAISIIQEESGTHFDPKVVE